MCDVFGSWVPCDISDEKKKKHVKGWHQNVTLFEQTPYFFLFIIIYGEFYVRYSDPELEQQ
jgi:hypothetical protein